MVMLDLPWDLVEEILSRVPVSSLREFRSTCKRWNALFKDPDFITNHLEKEVKHSLVLMLSDFRVYSLSMNLQDIHNKIAFDPSIKFRPQLSPQVEIKQVFHCDGLLLCSTKEGNKTKLVVVNPCNGQTRWIKPISDYHMSDTYVLGYENNNKHSYDSYKILRFPYGPYSLNFREIFELKSNSWRCLANIPPHGHMFGRCESVKGNTYWLSRFTSDILSFDFTTETFRSQHLRFPYQNFGFNTTALAVVREEQLAVLRSSLDMRHMEIWVMSNNMTDDDTELVLSFTFDFGSMFDLRSLSSYMSFFIDEDKKNVSVVGCGRSEKNNKNMIYIVGKHGYRRLDYRRFPLLFFRYVPSLVSLDLPM